MRNTRIINSGRQQGKTYMMIITSHVTGFPIVVSNCGRKHVVVDEAKKMGYEDVSVYTVSEMNRMTRINNILDKVLVDDAETMITDAIERYLGAEIVAMTMYIPFTESEKEKSTN